MDFAGIPLFNVMKAKLGYLSERQGVLAQNVANADMPSYKAKDVLAPDFKKMVAASAQNSKGGLQMATTNSKHINASAAYQASGNIMTRASSFELNPSGNNVSIEEEMAKVAENQAEYQKVLNLYRKSVDMFKTAIGKSSG